MGWGNLVSFVGLLLLVGFAWVLSKHRRAVNFRIVGWGVGLQLGLGAVVFLLPFGEPVFLFANEAVSHLFTYSREGVEFLFGPLAKPPGQEDSLGFFFAFQALPTVVFFSAITGLLYHWGVLSALVSFFATVFTRLMRISGAEAVCAASNIFIGVESAMTIRPFLRNMTRSELCLILTAGLATIASTVLGLYVMVLQPVFPEIAGHLVSASVLSAPAALVMAKMLLPETGEPVTLGERVRPQYEKKHNWIQAVTDASLEGFKLAVGIAVALIAFLGLLALVNGGTGWLGGLAGMPELRLERIAGFAFYPFVLLMGVPPGDASLVAELLGLRLFATEVPAYHQLAGLIENGAFASSRSVAIAAYSLCGFAHVASLGIFLGGIAALEPSRTQDLGAVGLRALLAATLACLMTGCIAGIFITDATHFLLQPE